MISYWKYHLGERVCALVAMNSYDVPVGSLGRVIGLVNENTYRVEWDTDKRNIVAFAHEIQHFVPINQRTWAIDNLNYDPFAMRPPTFRTKADEGFFHMCGPR